MHKMVIILGLFVISFANCSGQNGFYSEMETCLSTSGFEEDNAKHLNILQLVLDLENAFVKSGLIIMDNFESYYHAYRRISQEQLKCDSLMNAINILAPQSFLLMTPSNFTAPLGCFEEVSRRNNQARSAPVLINEYSVYSRIIVDGNITIESYRELIGVLAKPEEPIGAVHKAPPLMLLYSLLASKCTQ